MDGFWRPFDVVGLVGRLYSLISAIDSPLASDRLAFSCEHALVLLLSHAITSLFTWSG